MQEFEHDADFVTKCHKISPLKKSRDGTHDTPCRCIYLSVYLLVLTI